eukprot:6469354-Alexandrium_andersonii.AAC.1
MEMLILTFTSHIYRRHASIRLVDVSPWLESWVYPAVFGGVRGRSAQDAAWHHGVFVEKTKAAGSHCSAMSVDLFKCFDQIARPVLLLLGRKM